MVKELQRGGETYYICELCNRIFKEKQWAEKCQAFCEIHVSSIHTEIAKHAIKLPQGTD